MKKNKKVAGFKIAPEDSERFEKIKLEDTKVINNDRVDSLSNYDQVILEDLLLQVKTTTDKKVRVELKKKIKELTKKKKK